MKQALDALSIDRDVVRTYRDNLHQELQRLNNETARLRDAIGANYGSQGHQWHQALVERSKARRGRRR